MSYNPEIHNRRSIRLKSYDYSQSGYYFVTICTHGRVEYFGQIVDSHVILSVVGEIVSKTLIQLNNRFEQVTLDQFIIMPNHIHVIIIINKTCEKTLGQIIGAFKSITTLECIKLVKAKQYPGFNKKLWQLNYYERIIRNEKELLETQTYIVNNPAQWELDNLNPKNFQNP
jgi:putative transposase